MQERALDANVVRWRFDSAGQPQSNARFVRWSDGSLQLQLGGEVLDCSAVDVARDNSVLFARAPPPAPTLLASQGSLGVRLTLRPSTLDSKSHKLLAAAAAARHAKVTRVKKTLTQGDPEAEKAALEREELDRAKAADALARKRAAVDQRYALTDAAADGGAGLSKAFLEGAEDELGDAAPPPPAAAAAAARKRKAAAKPTKPRRSAMMLSSDDDSADGGRSWSEGGGDDD